MQADTETESDNAGTGSEAEDDLGAFIFDEIEEGDARYNQLLPLVQLMSELPARENEADRNNRLRRDRWITRFSLALLGLLAAFLATNAWFTDDPLTRQWSQTLLAGIVGGVTSYLFGSRA